MNRSLGAAPGLFAAAPAEFRLLALCCLWPPSDLRNTRIEMLTRSPLDWRRLLHLADRHRVTGFAHQALCSCRDVPAETRAALERQAGRIARSNLVALAQSSRTAAALQKESIPFVILKGFPLSKLAYNDISIRHSKDIDVLVAPDDVSRVALLLAEQGFRRTGMEEGLTPKQAQLWHRFRKHHEYLHAGSGVRLEVHWRAYDNPRLGSVDLTTPQWVEVAPGLRLPTLSRQELWLQLCAHGAAHAWFRLKWIADIAALLQQEESSQNQLAASSHLLDIARSRDLDRPVEQALLLCEALFPREDSPHARKHSAAGRWLARIARDALLEQTTRPHSVDADFVAKGLLRSRLLLRRSWRYRLEELRLRIVSPVDWKTSPLPSWLHFAYPLMRGPLWVKRRWLSRKSR